MSDDDGQGDLFDLNLSQYLKLLGIRKADDHADIEWKDAALFAVWRCAKKMTRLSADDVTRCIPSGFETHDMRAMGGIMRRGANRGWIESVGMLRSTRTKSHRGPRTAWRSLIRD